MEPVWHCAIACQETARMIKKQHVELMRSIAIKHSPAFYKLGGVDIIKAVAIKDPLALMKVMNSILENKETKGILLLMLKDITKLYKSNYKNVNVMIDCYMKHCTPEARVLTRESMRLVVNVMEVLGDQKIKEELNKIRAIMKGNIEYAVKRMKG